MQFWALGYESKIDKSDHRRDVGVFGSLSRITKE